jgi:NitT/TauT family transport system ATP-binding protein
MNIDPKDMETPEEAFAKMPPTVESEPEPAKPKQDEVPVAPEILRVELKNCCQSFDNNGVQKEIVKGLTFSVEGNETVAILGPSGCGKSTVLRMVSGMHPRGTPMPTTGECTINGDPVTGPRDEVLTVFQTPVLAGWLTVLGNIRLAFRPLLYGPRVRYPWEVVQDLAAGFTKGKVPYSAPTKEILERAVEILDAVGLKDAMYKFPHQLSGGMRQRASLATSLVVGPKILCMDEPFSALDPTTKIEMRKLLKKLRAQYQCMILFVTHDVSEALDLADRVLVLSASPATILGDLRLPKERPADWEHTSEYAAQEASILQMIREAKGNGKVAISL